jgi:hypothetical protein
MFKINKIQLIICFLIVFFSIITLTKAPVIASINNSENLNNNGSNIIIGHQVSLSLPNNYIGGYPAKDLDDLTKALEKINPDLASRLQPIKQQNLDVINLLALNTQIEDNNLIDNINVISEKNSDNRSLDEYISQQYNLLAFAEFKIESPEKITLANGKILKKIIIEFFQDEVKVKQLIYVLEDFEQFWTVTFTTSANRFNELLPIFETSINSLNISN